MSDIKDNGVHTPGRKKIRIAVTFTIVRDVPEDWSEDICRFHYEENHCLDNIARDLNTAVENSPGYCVCCPIAEAKYLGVV